MKLFAGVALSAAALAAMPAQAAETRLATYEFNGAAGATPSGWEADGNGRTFGRGVVRSMGSTNGNGQLEVAVETYDSSGGFREESMRTTAKYQPSAANRTYITVRASVRIPHTQAGIVHGLFMYTDWYVNGKKFQDELDFEWLTNATSINNPDPINVSSWKAWNAAAGYNQPYSSSNGMQKSETKPSGVNTEGWHQYEMKWFPNKLQFYVDGRLVREFGDANVLPTRAMPVFLNSWVPNSDWTDAYNGNFRPTGQAGNVTRMMQVDWLTIDRGTY